MWLSFRPGMTGAMPMPVSIPASESIRSVSKRWEGRLAPGSTARPVASSANGIERQTETFVSRDIAVSSGMSRRTRAPFVIIPTGLRKSRQTSRQRRVRPYTASSGW